MAEALAAVVGELAGGVVAGAVSAAWAPKPPLREARRVVVVPFIETLLPPTSASIGVHLLGCRRNKGRVTSL